MESFSYFCFTGDCWFAVLGKLLCFRISTREDVGLN